MQRIQLSKIDKLVSKLPPYIGKEIFQYVIPNSVDIHFRNGYTHPNNSYSPKYDIAYCNNAMIQNDQGLYLSRIKKRNGKHRYYMTQVISDVIEIEHYDQTYNMYRYDYASTYIGKDIDDALIRLFAS